MFDIDLDVLPDAESFKDLDDVEIRQVIREAEAAQDTAEAWIEAAFDELAHRSYRRMRPGPTLHERLRAAEQRRLERRKSRRR